MVFRSPEAGSYIQNDRTGYRTYLRQENGSYYLDLWVKKHNKNSDYSTDRNHNRKNDQDDHEIDGRHDYDQGKQYNRQAPGFAGPGM